MASPDSARPHRQRGIAESFGIDAARYDRTRPRYPAALIRRVLAASPGPEVLNVGSGTGIEARQFQAAGARVLGVEPDARMAEFAVRAAEQHEGFQVAVGTFEEWDAAGRRFDAVVAGQSWHWVDPDAGAVKAAEVLRPGGCFAAFWHVFEPPSPVAEACADALRAVAPELPAPPGAGQRGTPSAVDIYRGMLTTAGEGLARTAAFTEPRHWQFDWEQNYTRDEWLDLLPTIGLLTRLPADDLRTVLDAVASAIDAIGGGFTLRYRTVAVIAGRR